MHNMNLSLNFPNRQRVIKTFIDKSIENDVDWLPNLNRLDWWANDRFQPLFLALLDSCLFTCSREFVHLTSVSNMTMLYRTTFCMRLTIIFSFDIISAFVVAMVYKNLRVFIVDSNRLKACPFLSFCFGNINIFSIGKEYCVGQIHYKIVVDGSLLNSNHLTIACFSYTYHKLFTIANRAEFRVDNQSSQNSFPYNRTVFPFHGFSLCSLVFGREVFTETMSCYLQLVLFYWNTGSGIAPSTLKLLNGQDE